MNLKITEIKAFTQDPESGNPAVVIEGDTEAPETLEAVKAARYSVAAVIDPTQDPTPILFFYEFGQTETFACGHATLAAAEVLLLNKPSGQFINTHGTLIDVNRTNEGRISQEQGLPSLGEVFDSSETLQIALGLLSESIQKDLPVQAAGMTGKMKLLIPVTAEDLLNIDRNHDQVMANCESHQTTGLCPFTTDIEGFDAHARHFPNRDEEDLVCGVGAVALAVYLKTHVDPSKSSFKIKWGPGPDGAGDVLVRFDAGKVYLEGYATKPAQ